MYSSARRFHFTLIARAAASRAAGEKPFSFERSGLPNFRPLAFAAAKAALIRSEMRRDSYSATAARICTVKRLASGMSAATKSTPLFMRLAIMATFRASRSRRAMISRAS